MRNLFFIIGLHLIILINTGCPTPCVEANFSFAVNSQFTPDFDSIKVGDTIYLTSTFSTTLTDLHSNTLVDYNNSTGIGSDIYISRFDSINNITSDAVLISAISQIKDAYIMIEMFPGQMVYNK